MSSNPYGRNREESGEEGTSFARNSTDDLALSSETWYTAERLLLHTSSAEACRHPTETSTLRESGRNSSVSPEDCAHSVADAHCSCANTETALGALMLLQ